MKYAWNVGERKGTPLQTVLTNRKVTTPEQEAAFMSPSLGQLHDPFLMHGMRKAAERIVEAIKAKQKITIYGDYDVDGITGTTTMLLALKMYGADVDFYIPHRVDEGYGLHSESMKTISERGTKLVVTVDCGITAVEPVETCKALGMEIIISDHHEWKATLPAAYALVHPRLGEMTAIEDMDQRPTGDFHMEDSLYPNPDLCGSGVAFKLALAVGKLMNDGVRVAPDCAPFFAQALAFTALGTIADVMKLVGENRAIAVCGMKRITNTCFPGLKGFLTSAKLEGEEIDGYKVGFTLAPRLNAAGRMGHANLAVSLLTQEDFHKAETIGAELESQNIRRQETEKKIVKEAEAYVEWLLADGKPSEVLVVLGRGWHPGVVGIVASRISEKYHRPTLVLIKGEHHCHGSGRSVDGFNLTEAIGSCEGLVKNYGGHAMACGVRIENDKIEDFRAVVCEYARNHQTPEMKKPEIKIECEAQLDEMDIPLAETLVRVGPFGPGNRKPFFIFRNVTLRGPRRIGKEGQYLMFFADDGACVRKAVWFKPTEEAFKLVDGDKIDFVAEPAINEYQNKVTVQLMVRDVRHASQGQDGLSLLPV